MITLLSKFGSEPISAVGGFSAGAQGPGDDIGLAEFRIGQAQSVWEAAQAAERDALQARDVHEFVGELGVLPLPPAYW
jgi:hypothetical protein